MTLIVLLPALGALITLFVHPERKEAIHWLASLIAAADLCIALFLYMGWIFGAEGGFQFVDGPWAWVPSLGIRYYLGIDGLSLHAALLIVVLVPLILLAAWSPGDPPTTWPYKDKQLAFWMLLLESSLLGALASLNLVLFAVFWTLSLVALCFLLSSSTAVPEAARLLILPAVAACILVLAPIAIVTSLYPEIDIASAPDALQLSIGALSQTAQAWCFWSLTLAFGLASALFPLHLWYIRAHRQTHIAFKLAISGLFLNLGLYGLARFSLAVFPLMASRFAPVLVILGAVGLVYNGLAALGKRSWSAVIASWNLAQVSLTWIGMFSLENIGVYGAIMQMTARSLAAAALLLASNSDSDLAPQNRTAVRRAALAAAIWSAIGMPGSIGFDGQGSLLIGLTRWRFQWSASALVNRASDIALYAAIAFGLITSTWALLRVWQRPLAHSAGDRHARLALLAIPLLILMLFLGLRQETTMDMIGPTVHTYLSAMPQKPDMAAQQAALPGLHYPGSLSSLNAAATGERTAQAARLTDIRARRPSNDWRFSSPRQLYANRTYCTVRGLYDRILTL